MPQAGTTINVTRGCLHRCVYCYARGFRNVPGRNGDVCLYTNLPEKLADELKRKRKMPARVSFSTSSDPFQAHPAILDVTLSCMEILLSYGVAVNFLTKGTVPGAFMELFSRYPRFVTARIGLASTEDDYVNFFEPGTARPAERLCSASLLTNMGIETSLRIDPLIHGVTDSDEALNRVMKAAAVAGISRVTISFLYMRPSLVEHMRKELPRDQAEDVLRWYRGRPFQDVITSRMTQLLSPDIRIARYESAKRIAARYGLACAVCGCKNPDLPFESCDPLLASTGRLSYSPNEPSPVSLDHLPLFS